MLFKGNLHVNMYRLSSTNLSKVAEGTGEMNKQNVLSPNHKDIIVMSLSIQEQDVHSIKERLRKEHQQRLKDIIAKHKKKLEENILCTTEHHKNNTNKLTEQLDYETNSLMLYEAKEIQNNNWIIENRKCEQINQRGLEQLSKALARARVMLDREKEEALKKTTSEQKQLTKQRLEKLKAQHVEELKAELFNVEGLKHYDLMWQEKSRTHWGKIKTTIEEKHRNILSKHQKILQEQLTKAVECRQKELQPVLDHTKQQWCSIHDDNAILQANVESLKIKELAGKMHLQKLLQSFKAFIGTTTQLDDEQCDLLMETKLRNKDFTINSIH